jgi:hypothetical protein
MPGKNFFPGFKKKYSQPPGRLFSRVFRPALAAARLPGPASEDRLRRPADFLPEPLRQCQIYDRPAAGFKEGPLKRAEKVVLRGAIEAGGKIGFTGAIEADGKRGFTGGS